jgi:hypothetical protein
MYYGSPPIVTNGLVLALDAGNTKSYTSGSTVWRDLTNPLVSGSLINGPTFSNQNGGSIVFDGSNDRVQISDFNYGRSGCTVAAWVKYNATVGNYNEGVISKWQTGADVFNEFILSSNDLAATSPKYAGFYIFNTNNTTVGASDTSTIMIPGTWYYLLGTFDGSYVRVYLNGMFKVISSLSSSPTIKTVSSQPIALASFGSSFQYNTNCNIAATQIYNRALSAQEVAQNYNATKTRFGL